MDALSPKDYPPITKGHIRGKQQEVITNQFKYYNNEKNNVSKNACSLYVILFVLPYINWTG